MNPLNLVILVCLGAGKFKSFEFAVLTGVEIVPGYDQRLEMVKHKSTSYNLFDGVIKWVF